MSGHESHSRIPSMDQFRGYAILTMIFVNFVGRFDATPWMLQHHRTGMSFNDTIAPIFIFVVGMGFRLSLLRRAEKIGIAAARKAAAWRYAKLTILGFIVYFGYFWDALSDIGVAGLLTLFLIDKSPAVRIAAAFGLLGAYQALFSLAGYGEWVMRESVNGGPLGPLSWAFILLMGTVAYDALNEGGTGAILRRCMAWGLALSAAGWLLKMPWPGVKPEWPFTQYGMSAPYPLYATGLCFLTLLAFHLLCDVGRVRLPHLTILGENPLALYLLHGVLILIGHLILNADASPRAIVTGFIVIYAICYAFAVVLRRKKIIFKI
ncbi:MAG TPA: heparan-alpha-glucosaminide N-acetyltransferase domain-containing protein [Candidatus Hydrogenedentes bacterium]|nr:heparan-alpha-glucosaminide N-acetyltransferase domain-containing protein [Candidatus Hydrogenedentota bacterium]HOV74190.1 heparan-alpha-glucosaminide N-acetyltransferase domain-containing protein [Candidatus Hydrogenedentota bacterium]HPC15729.1 heparan-alpha-glucosaminide N-acetyltransferase domain-containing protein [Candidatus Hydrogenedentota bacterium]HRT19647.1 heparan-alpha-glucosaminide N-acetyltransferase domain-containing protein [Candidatus Hydrogenedentota bacterium]HRT64421.1 